MARKINAVSPNESRLNGYFADPERRNTSNFRGISYEDERRADANEIYESGTKWVNEQLQSGGGSGGGGGAQPDWNAAEGEPGHILNRTHYYKIVEGDTVALNNLVAAEEGMYLYFGDPVVFIPGREYDIRYAGTTYNCIGVDPSTLGEALDGGCIFGNTGAIPGGDDTGEPFAIISYGRKMADMGGASAIIMDMSGSTLHYVHISGPRREREKLAPEWLPYPPIDMLRYTVTSYDEGNGRYTVSNLYSYSDVASKLADGYILSAVVDLGVGLVGLNFVRKSDNSIDFVNRDNFGNYSLSINSDGHTDFYATNN